MMCFVLPAFSTLDHWTAPHSHNITQGCCQHREHPNTKTKTGSPKPSQPLQATQPTQKLTDHLKLIKAGAELRPSAEHIAWNITTFSTRSSQTSSAQDDLRKASSITRVGTITYPRSWNTKEENDQRRLKGAGKLMLLM